MDSRDCFIEALLYLMGKGKHTQKEVADFMPVDPPQFNQFIKKKRNFSESKRSRIAEFFKISYMDMLLMGKEIIDTGEPTEQIDESEDIISVHQDLVKGFKYKAHGLRANRALITVEDIDRKTFFRVVADLENLAAGLLEKKETPKEDVKTGLLGGENDFKTGIG